MADVKYEKQSPAKRFRSEVVVAKEDPRDKAFSRELALTVKQELKPEFDQVSSHLTKLDTRLANLETSNGDIQSKLSQIISKLG